MREAGKLVAECFAALQEAVRPSITLRELDRIVTNLIEQRGALPLYKNYRGNPPDHPPFPESFALRLIRKSVTDSPMIDS